jgi:transcription initiation factor TFIIA large subunit
MWRWLHSYEHNSWLQVSRTKTRVGTKWKCQMKNGIMHLNGRDIIFHKGNGEMQF